MNDEIPAQADIGSIFASLMRNAKPMNEAKHRAYTLNSEIFPTIGRWGFPDRFHVEQGTMHKAHRAAYDDMRSHLRGKGAVIALIGPRGLGKTTLAAQFAIETAWRNRIEATKEDGPRFIQHVVYRKTASLLARYKPIFSDFGSIETETLMESLDFLCRQQEFLVIDELHECDDMKVKNRLITDIVDRRYSACRDTVIIANQTAEEFAASAGDSIMSRLSEHGCIIPCSWPSYRSANP
jgi:DNA replication protein DnaC